MDGKGGEFVVLQLEGYHSHSISLFEKEDSCYP